MNIQKQKDGSSKVVYENGVYFFVGKGKDPIDGVIDIWQEQQKFSNFLGDRHSISYTKPMAFLFCIYLDYGDKACRNLHNKDWYLSAITEFNLEIKRQQLLREHNKTIDDSRMLSQADTSACEEGGKYFIDMEGVPTLWTMTSETTEDDLVSNYLKYTSDEPVESFSWIVASVLLNLIYCLVDIRKIEDRISELKGLCEYLKMIAPDEYNAYCVLGDKFGYNAELDIDRYYEILKSLT